MERLTRTGRPDFDTPTEPTSPRGGDSGAALRLVRSASPPPSTNSVEAFGSPTPAAAPPPAMGTTLAQVAPEQVVLKSSSTARQGFWRSLTSAAGDALCSLARGAVDATVGLVKNGVEAARTLAGGLGKVATGRVGEGLAQLGHGLVKVVQTPVDALMMLGGRALGAVQTLLGVEPVGRKLADSELAALRSVYGDALDYSRIRIKEGNAGLLTMSGRPFTLGDTIYIPRKHLPLTEELLVHESAHVWQHQNGGTDYMSESLVGQYLGDGYDYAKALREGMPWAEMNPEQQAELLEQAFRKGCFGAPPKPFLVNGKDYSAQLAAIREDVRAGRGAP
ncbi:hypothetical protein JY651_08060 [Pyxidicoccus parkwayensis]|uniref:DUF4157 domain-containing protein n=1 Tax=Pyxidicoccus parkwayensis TaxID=2813578 RepID=A0ABX7P360_9BACT|nr:hypothetical protein [Pyxidicoccus parkwaysis]QSQ24881.1 hypothetical protein JY651_08060 [Pyxidicoccus parkwaysis]